MSKKVYITRRERFSAAHKMWNPAWDEQRNLEVFGQCANVNWHGHNYELFVTVTGTPDPATGYAIDLKVLSAIIKEKVIDLLDHKNLNMDVDFLRHQLISTENVAIGIWEQLEGAVKETGCVLYCVKLYETENNFVEYFGGMQ